MESHRESRGAFACLAPLPLFPIKPAIIQIYMSMQGTRAQFKGLMVIGLRLMIKKGIVGTSLHVGIPPYVNIRCPVHQFLDFFINPLPFSYQFAFPRESPLLRSTDDASCKTSY